MAKQVYIVSPGFSDLLLAHIRKGFPATRCVMLQTSLADGAMTHLYDEVVSICDPAADIRERLSRLVGESSLQRRNGSLSRRNISSKLDIHSASGLTVYAIRNRLVRLDELSEKER